MATAVIGMFIPSRKLGWVNDLAAIVRLPMVPFGDVGTRARVWMTSEQHDAAELETIEHLRQELDRFHVLFQAERQRNRSLVQQIEQYERTQYVGTGVDFRPVSAHITGRDAEGGAEVYVLNVGANRGVTVGAVAVFDGSHLIGRIGSVASLTSTLIPITEPRAGYLQASVAGSERTQGSGDGEPPHTLLRGANDGMLRGDVDRSAGVQLNDIVYLDDPNWPRTARAMIIGQVVAVEPKDENPLHVRITVKPRFTASGVTNVTIKVETPGDGVRLGEAE